MERLKVEGEGGSEILLGIGLASLASLAPVDRILVTDANVRHHWGHLMEGERVLEVGLGENAKTLSSVESLYEGLLRFEADRSTCIVGVGGGIVCDVAGFAASTYLRGLDFGFIATTLLAQVDASVGGKNGVNFHGLKNHVGLIRQPRFVACDFQCLETLPDREYASGLAELVKIAAIADASLFAFLEAQVEALRNRDRSCLEKAVARAVALKAHFVAVDEQERGERKKLNFGHTLGHALESHLGLRHGEAVSLGMVAAAELSVKRGLLAPHEAQRLTALLDRCGLPTHRITNFDALMPLMERDKKRQGRHLAFVLLQGLGHGVIQPLEVAELREALS